MTSSTFVLPDHADMVRNIRTVLESASGEQHVAGLNWYADSYRIASALASKHDISIPRAAGVLAALSPRQGWGANVNMAARCIAMRGTMTTGYMRMGLDKAARILRTAQPSVDTPDILGGPKTRAFYASILFAGATDDVCVDRHAFSIAVGDRTLDAEMPKLTPKRYAAIVAAYVEVARETFLSGAQVQAITWVAWRAQFHKEGAFDSYNEI